MRVKKGKSAGFLLMFFFFLLFGAAFSRAAGPEKPALYGSAARADNEKGCDLKAEEGSSLTLPVYNFRGSFLARGDKKGEQTRMESLLFRMFLSASLLLALRLLY